MPGEAAARVSSQVAREESVEGGVVVDMRKQKYPGLACKKLWWPLWTSTRVKLPGGQIARDWLLKVVKHNLKYLRTSRMGRHALIFDQACAVLGPDYPDNSVRLKSKARVVSF